MKKLIASLLALCLLVAFPLSAAAADASNNAEIVDPQRFTSILSEYEREFALIEQETGVSIHELTERNFALIKTQAVDNLDNSMYRFGELMDSIVRAKVDYTYDQNNAVSPLAQDRIETIWYPSETLVKYCALAGTAGEEIAASTSKGTTLTISFSAGAKVKGVTLTAAFLGADSLTVYGPSQNDTLHNGMKASHSIPTAITYGSIVEKQWDSVNIDTGEVIRHGRIVMIDGDRTIAYMSYANIEVAVYVDSPTKYSTSWYSTMDSFHTSIKTNPDKYLGN